MTTTIPNVRVWIAARSAKLAGFQIKQHVPNPVDFAALGANWVTAALGATALVSYVAVYTPMKTQSPVALIVGAVPGALPPLMGWTAARGA